MESRDTHIIYRYNTAANWQEANPILMQGEFGVEIEEDPNHPGQYINKQLQIKAGDGHTRWNSLGYIIVKADEPGPEYTIGDGLELLSNDRLSACLLYDIVEGK